MGKKKKIPQIVKEIRNQPKPWVDYKNNNVISFTQLSTFYKCNLKWYLQYVKKLHKYQPNINVVFGTAIHNTIQEYLTVFYNETKVKADNLDLNNIFKDYLKKSFDKGYKDNNNQHFTTPEILNEFYNDGVGILDEFKKKKGKYFSKRGWHLIGCEVPLLTQIYPEEKNILYKGDLDIILYNENVGTLKIIDLKTSTKSWGKYQKGDEITQTQLILYKYYISKIFNIPLDKIEIEFLILKRKIYEDSEWVQSRLQSFTPNSGKIKVKKSLKLIEGFIEETKNPENKKFLPKFTKLCDYCVFNNTEHCNKKLKK
jgi:hypothetical protein